MHRVLAAAAALGRLDTGQSARSFLHTSGADAGRGVFTTWHAKKFGRLADHAAWLVYQHWATSGQPNRAELVGRYACAAGGRDPRLAAAHAHRIATAASTERLTEARNICDQAVQHCGDSTDEGWTELRQARNRIAGQLTRRQPKPSGNIDTDGNPIPRRRHHPDKPERTRAGRLTLAKNDQATALRQGPTASAFGPARKWPTGVRE